MQETASVARQLTVFQRTANWCVPIRNQATTGEYDAFVKANYPEIRRLEKDLLCSGMVLSGGEISPPETRNAMDVSPEEREAGLERRWERGGLQMAFAWADLLLNPAANETLREFLTAKIRSVVRDPRTAELLIPSHAPFTRRAPGEIGFYEAFNRDNVELVDVHSDPIAEVTQTGLRLNSGREVALDVLVCATGFDVARFLAPVEITGRDGLRLRDVWDDDDARAFFGTAVPGFPNLLMLIGPNTQAGHGGSVIGTSEAQVHYVLSLLGQMLQAGAGSVEVREERYEEYNRVVDAAHEDMIWTHPGMTTYYRNSRGRVVVPSPWRIVQFWLMTQHAELEDYLLEPAPAAV